MSSTEPQPRAITDALSALTASARTASRPLAAVVHGAAAITLPAARLSSPTWRRILEAADGALGATPCDAASVELVHAWLSGLPSFSRLLGAVLLFSAATSERILDQRFGARILAGGISANPVWAGGSRGIAVGGMVGEDGRDLAAKIISSTGTRGPEGSTADQLRRGMSKIQNIWVTNTHLLFIEAPGKAVDGGHFVRAALPLADVVGVKKAIRLQLLARFSLVFADGSRAAFMGPGNGPARLRAALAEMGIGAR